MGPWCVPASMALVVALSACAGEQRTELAAVPQFDMTGRWTLSAPNSPSCGIELDGTPGEDSGAVRPEGGCPGNFFMSRHWALARDTLVLTIADDKYQPLGRLQVAEGRFAGQSSSGLPIELTR